ncbi:hypothetical protein BRC97_04060 [Halobacteriales archaeon QS_6_71_20]|nr:MAG: hypothetical protein BRC97_04060 [Halobacteriales archaeon QS_6_71_20]
MWAFDLDRSDDARQLTAFERGVRERAVEGRRVSGTGTLVDRKGPTRPEAGARRSDAATPASGVSMGRRAGGSPGGQ